MIAEPFSFTWVAALYAVCAHYHSGQWSRGYRLLCYLQRRYRPRNVLDWVESELGGEGDGDDELVETYHYLASRYGEEL